ncbi:MAG: hypothetical protein AAGD12_02195 [Pseudomonadota bacterium]
MFDLARLVRLRLPPSAPPAPHPDSSTGGLCVLPKPHTASRLRFWPLQ